tara:strand:- start:489 stop:722 length:234 start_codon:yes stop_codon:yes gene_type:complete
MGFHKRYIRGENIITRYKKEGAKSVYNLYIKGVDALILNGELASNINDILNIQKLGEKEILEKISREIELSEDFKKF